MSAPHKRTADPSRASPARDDKNQISGSLFLCGERQLAAEAGFEFASAVAGDGQVGFFRVTQADV